MRVDPLDHLFAPTTAPRAPDAAHTDAAMARPVVPELTHASVARPPRGTRSRSGNAMGRTRQAVLAGARAAVAESGTAITMTQVAALSGIAKATLYNHFRSREALLEALLSDEVDQLLTAVAGLPLADALSAAALSIGRNPLLASLSTHEPSTLAVIARIDLRSPGWRRAADALRTELERSRRGGGELVLRWLASFLINPVDPDGQADVSASASALVRALPIIA
jgi:AcrR family transcriptional regulator